MKTSALVDDYILDHVIHKEILLKIRKLLAEFPFEEEIKWGRPTYSYKQRNLIGTGAFKKHVGLWFFQGALLQDHANILHNAQKDKTKAMRQVRFHNVDEVDCALLRHYIAETIANQDRGLVIKKEYTRSELVLPRELEHVLKIDELLSDRFQALSPAKKRDFAAYIRHAKRERTKTNRLIKIIPLIISGKGLNDQYRNKE